MPCLTTKGLKKEGNCMLTAFLLSWSILETCPSSLLGCLLLPFPKKARRNWLIVQKAEQGFESKSPIAAVLSIAGANITILSGTGPWSLSCSTQHLLQYSPESLYAVVSQVLWVKAWKVISLLVTVGLSYCFLNPYIPWETEPSRQLSFLLAMSVSEDVHDPWLSCYFCYLELPAEAGLVIL